jgi:malonyl-CoA O-methyltransferase
MLKKELIKNNFTKCCSSYNDNALTQKYMATVLVDLLIRNNMTSFEQTLEIGAGTGVLTKEIKNLLKIKNYFANDIIENYHDYILKEIPQAKFYDGDIEEVRLEESFDLIISNASLQWLEDTQSFFEKIAKHTNENGLFAFSTFNNDNMPEIKDIFDVSLDYFNKTELIALLEPYYQIIAYKEEKKILSFDNCLSVLKHLKLTGTNSIKTLFLSKRILKEKEEFYKSLHSNNYGKLKLTYSPLWFLCKRR